MSHIVTIKTEIRDRAAVEAACRRLGLAEPTTGTFKLYGSKATGLAVNLPGWSYPVVCDLASGQLRYDNFGGCWGKPEELEKFLQSYAVEMAKIQARKKGYSVSESQRADGNIVVTINTGEGQPGASPSLWGRFRSMFSGRT